MTKSLDDRSGFSPNDRALIAEAVRRVRRQVGSRADNAAILEAVSCAMREGRRDLFGLVRAGSNAAHAAQ